MSIERFSQLIGNHPDISAYAKYGGLGKKAFLVIDSNHQLKITELGLLQRIKRVILNILNSMNSELGNPIARKLEDIDFEQVYAKVNSTTSLTEDQKINWCSFIARVQKMQFKEDKFILKILKNEKKGVNWNLIDEKSKAKQMKLFNYLIDIPIFKEKYHEFLNRDTRRESDVERYGHDALEEPQNDPSFMVDFLDSDECHELVSIIEDSQQLKTKLTEQNLPLEQTLRERIAQTPAMKSELKHFVKGEGSVACLKFLLSIPRVHLMIKNHLITEHADENIEFIDKVMTLKSEIASMRGGQVGKEKIDTKVANRFKELYDQYFEQINIPYKYREQAQTVEKDADKMLGLLDNCANCLYDNIKTDIVPRFLTTLQGQELIGVIKTILNVE